MVHCTDDGTVMDLPSTCAAGLRPQLSGYIDHSICCHQGRWVNDEDVIPLGAVQVLIRLDIDNMWRIVEEAQFQVTSKGC